MRPSKRDLQRDLPLDQFIPTATNGVEFAPRPGIDRSVLIASFFQRPLVGHVEVGDALLIIYPVADESVTAETDTPPLRLVRLSKALGDEKRLRILRTLADGEMTLMELAEVFGVAKTTMHHHMIILRAAGLVSVGVELQALPPPPGDRAGRRSTAQRVPRRREPSLRGVEVARSSKRLRLGDLRLELLQELGGDVEVGVDVLHVVEILEPLHEPEHRPRGLLVS